MLHSPNPVAWIIVFVCISLTDFVWFRLTGDAIYKFDDLLTTNVPEAGVAVLLCAAFASLVLCSFESGGYGEAALTGAAIGGLVFFVFNACALYILNNLKLTALGSEEQPRWRLTTAAADMCYGTALYTLMAVFGHYLDGAV